MKHIEEADHNVTLFRIQEILSEHRTMLITGILTDLPTYPQFKSYGKVDKEMLGILRDKLWDLSNSKVNLDRYEEIIQEIKTNSSRSGVSFCVRSRARFAIGYTPGSYTTQARAMTVAEPGELIPKNKSGLDYPG